MKQRFGETAELHYHDVSRPEVRESHDQMVRTIQDMGLVYPVTVIDGKPLYDGAVSYPAILRAVDAKLSQPAEA